MENKNILNLLDKVPRIQNDKLATLFSELIQIIETEGQKLQKEEIKKSQFSELTLYLIKRFLNGSTTTDAIQQSRYLTLMELLLNNSQVSDSLDLKKVMIMMDNIVHPKNSLTKGEKIFLQNSYSHNLIILVSSFVGRDAGEQTHSEQIDQLMNRIRQNLGIKENYVYFVAGNITKLVQLLEGIKKIEVEGEAEGSENYESHHLHKKVKYEQTLKLLVERLAGCNVKGESFRSNYFWLAMRLAAYHLEKSESVEIDEKVVKMLRDKAKSLLSKEILQKVWLEIVKDDKCNTKLVVPYYNTVAEIAKMELSNFYPIVLQFLGSILKSLEKVKDLVQKKAMHFSLFLGSLISALGYQTFLGIDGIVSTFKIVIDEQLQAEGGNGNKLDLAQKGNSKNPLALVLIHSIQFWLKQLGQKNQLSKLASSKVESALVESLDVHSIGKGKKNKELKKQIQDIHFYLLLLTKTTPGSSLSRSKKSTLSNVLYSGLYLNKNNFKTYFSHLKSKLSQSLKVSHVNFYLDEIMALGQAGISGKAIKQMSEKELLKVVELRIQIIGYMSKMLAQCEKEHMGSEGIMFQKVDLSQEEKFTVRKFRNHLFDRILDIIFKREDSLFLEHGANTFSDTIRNNLNKDLLPNFIDFAQMLSNAKEKLNGKSTAEPAHLTLLDALILQNPFTDDIEKNNEIVTDLVSSITKLGGSKKKLKVANTDTTIPNPIEVLVDSVIALTSTTYPQIKYVLNAAYEASVPYITGNGMGLIVDAITRVDQEYIRDQMYGAEEGDMDIEEDGDMAEEDSSDGEE